jgi:hypothetical protein
MRRDGSDVEICLEVGCTASFYSHHWSSVLRQLSESIPVEWKVQRGIVPPDSLRAETPQVEFCLGSSRMSIQVRVECEGQQSRYSSQCSAALQHRYL